MRASLLLIILFFTLSASAQQQQKREQIVVDGIKREFVTYIPAISNTSDKLAVIISLHGRVGTGRGMMDFADFRRIAVHEKFLIVCPDGISRSWNDGRPTPAQKKGINDVNFIDQLITYIINTYPVDASRVYLTGMSNGGFMASRLACELSNRIAAVAVVGASMDKDMGYQPKKQIPILYIQGTSDPLVPYTGGTMKGAGGDIYSHTDVLTFWATKDGCGTKPVITNIPDDAKDGTSIIKEEFTNQTSGIKVTGYTVTNGGHTWPGGSQYLPKFLIGTVSHNMNACEVIWDFFKGYRLVE